MAKRSILVVDDEKDIQKLLQFNLEKEGYQVRLAKTGEEGHEMVKSQKPDLVILDLMLPGIDGLEVCKLIRSNPSTKHLPVIMLTAKNTDTDQIVGLELGASDYISKPFSVQVLLARIKNIFKNETSGKELSSVIQAGDMKLDRDKHRFQIKDKIIALTKLEFSLLGFLMENRGKVFSREKLLEGAWEGDAFVVDRTIDVHIKSIRHKLGKHREFIETVRGAGYRFVDSEDRP